MHTHSKNRLSVAKGTALAALAAMLLFTALARAEDAELQKYQAAEKLANEHLATFDTLDFDVFTNQKWDRLKESHG